MSAPRIRFADEHLGPMVQVRVTPALEQAIKDEAARRGVTLAGVTRQALLLGLRAMGHPVTYADARELGR